MLKGRLSNLNKLAGTEHFKRNSEFAKLVFNILESIKSRLSIQIKKQALITHTKPYLKLMLHFSLKLF